MQSIESGTDNSPSYNRQNFHKLQKLQENIYIYLEQFQKYFKSISNKKKQSELNTQKIHNTLLALFSQSFKPLAYILIFLEDKDLINIASTCKLSYNPLGYRLTTNLRPIIKKLKQKPKDIEISQSALKNLCEDRSYKDLQQDDKMAVLITMKTKLMASKQKIKELDRQNQKLEKQNQKYITQLSQINIKREDYQKRIVSYKAQIEKFVEEIRFNSESIKNFKDNSQNVAYEKQNKILTLESQRQKLKRQKQLLIKKIMLLQEQKKSKEVYTEECQKIFSLMRKITTHTKSSKK